MNDPIFWRMVWKEYRTQRGFWLIVTASALGFQLLLLNSPGSLANHSAGLFLTAIWLSACYALGCGAVLFAAEREDGTFDLLRSLPASPARVLLSKFSFGVASTILMLMLLGLSASVLVQGHHPKMHLWTVTQMGLFTLEFLLWGIFFSLLTRRVLNAVFLAIAAFLTVSYVVAPSEVARFEPARLIILAAVAAADVWLARRWMLERRFVWSLTWPRRRSRASLADLAAAKGTAPPWRRLLRRLLWQEWRNARPFVGIYCGTFLLLLACSWLLARLLYTNLAYFIIPVTPFLFGLWTFRGEQEGRHFRFPAERGIPPEALWLSKQLVWLPLALAVTLAFVLTDYFGTNAWSYLMADASLLWGPQTSSGKELWGVFHDIFVLRRRYGWPETSTGWRVLLFISLTYGCGQLTSMLIPRAVTAGFLGLVLTGVLVAWFWLMHWLQVPLLWSVAPIPLILLAATFVRSTGWMLERHKWTAWLRVGVVCLLPAVLIVAVVAVYRVYEIPAAGPGFSVQEYLRPITPQETETARMYEQAVAVLTPHPKELQPEDSKSIDDGWEHATPEVKQWVRENQEALNLTLKATERNECVLVDPARATLKWRPWIQKTRRLGTLLRYSARKLEAEDKLDESLAHYVAALRLSRHVANRGSLHVWSIHNAITTSVYRWMPHWAAHPKQTHARLVAAIRQIEKETATIPPLGDAVKTEHLIYSAPLSENWSDAMEILQQVHSSEAVALDRLRRWFPWERTRAIRVLDAMTADSLARAHDLELRLARRGADLIYWAARDWDARNRQHANPPWKWRFTTPLLDRLHPTSARWAEIGGISCEARRRALLLTLSLVAWQHEHGELPSRLDVLVGPYFVELPLDPWSGREYGYRPGGFPTPVRFYHAVIEAGQPLLWSAGQGNGRIVQKGQTEDGRPRFVVVGSRGLPSRPDQRRRPDWGTATPFPIPQL